MKGLERLTFSHFIEDLIFRGKKVISTKKYNQHAQRVMKSIIFLRYNVICSAYIFTCCFPKLLFYVWQ